MKHFTRTVALCGLIFLAAVVRADDTSDAPEVTLGKGAYVAGAPAELSSEEAARQLANPNTPLASLTLKSQWTRWSGDLPGAEGHDSQTFLFQPNFPFPVSKTDTIFVRPAFPYLVDQPVIDGSGSVEAKTGFGDMGMDLAYGRTTGSGLLMAGGLVTMLPTGADRLSSDTWTLGPEFLIGRISSTSLVAIFPSHQWDVSGPKKTSLTSIQPILSFLPGGGWSVSYSGTSTYDWEREQWTIPLNLVVSRTIKIGKMPLKLALDANYYVEKADPLGQDWMIGFNITPVVPNVLAEWLRNK